MFQVTCNFEIGKVGRKIFFFDKKFLHGHDGDYRETKLLNGKIPWNLNNLELGEKIRHSRVPETHTF